MLVHLMGHVSNGGNQNHVCMSGDLMTTGQTGLCCILKNIDL